MMQGSHLLFCLRNSGLNKEAKLFSFIILVGERVTVSASGECPLSFPHSEQLLLWCHSIALQLQWYAFILLLSFFISVLELRAYFASYLAHIGKLMCFFLQDTVSIMWCSSTWDLPLLLSTVLSIALLRVHLFFSPLLVNAFMYFRKMCLHYSVKMTSPLKIESGVVVVRTSLMYFYCIHSITTSNRNCPDKQSGTMPLWGFCLEPCTV